VNECKPLHVGLIYDGATVTLTFNGAVAAASETFADVKPAENPYPADADFTVGFNVVGAVDEVKLWDGSKVGLAMRPISVYRPGEMPIQSCGQRVSAPRGKAGARLNAHTELRTKRQRSAREAMYRNRPVIPRHVI